MNFFGVKTSSDYCDTSSFQIADTFLLTVRSSGAKNSSRPVNQSIISRTSSRWLTGMP